MADQTIDGIGPFVNEIRREHDIPGIAVAASRGGRRVLGHGFGTRDLEQGGMVDTHTVFGLASVSKSFTAIAIMQLAETQKLSISDKAARYLPPLATALREYGKDVTVHHLLTHTSGLPPLGSRFFALSAASKNDPFAAPTPDWVDGPDSIDTAEELLDYVADYGQAPLGAPGQVFSYSNEGFVLLGKIIEVVSGEAYPDYINRHIIEPLGLERTGFDRAELATRHRLATLHAISHEGGVLSVVPAPAPTYTPLWFPAGGLNSSVEDLLVYLQLYVGSGVSRDARVISPSSVTAMMTPHVPGLAPGEGYGYGLSVKQGYLDVSVVHHGGGSKGVSAHVVVVAEAKICAAALANLAACPTQRLALGMVNGMLGGSIDKELQTYPTVRDNPLLAGRYCGTYRSDEGVELSVSLRDDRLVVRVGDEEKIARFSVERSVVIALPSGDALVRFLFDGPGVAYAIAFGGRVLHRAR